MSAGRPSASDVVAVARRSLVSVRGGASGGTGWVVLANGLVMTSHDAVGYQPTVLLELEGGRRVEGQVIWVDVARDLAMVLPHEPLSLPPLLPRPDLPRLGETALSLSAVPDAPWRVASGVVSAVDYRVGPLRCFEIDTPVTSNGMSGGGPIVDLTGNVLGIGGLDLPRGTRRALAGGAAAASHSLAIPIAALSRALAAVDIAVEQFAGRTPTYRCPSCNEPFQPRDERCASCGRLLPHGWEAGDAAGRADRAALAGAERLVRDLLGELGAASTSVRVGPRTYRVSSPGSDGALTHLTLEIDEGGTAVLGKIPLLRVPAANQEPFYRFLLNLNDQTLGGQRFSVEGDTVYLSFAEPTSLVRPGEGASRVQDLVREADRYKKALSEPFDCG